MPERLRFLFEFDAARRSRDAASRRGAARGRRARGDRGARRGAADGAAARSRGVPRGGRPREASGPDRRARALFHPIRVALTGDGGRTRTRSRRCRRSSAARSCRRTPAWRRSSAAASARDRRSLRSATSVTRALEITRCPMLIYGINAGSRKRWGGRVRRRSRARPRAIERLRGGCSTMAERAGVPVERVGCRGARSRGTRRRAPGRRRRVERAAGLRASRISSTARAGGAADRRARRHRGSAQLRRDPADRRCGGRARRGAADPPRRVAGRRGGQSVGGRGRARADRRRS